MNEKNTKQVTVRKLASLYCKAHNLMRNSAGLHPQEAFDELLKYLFFKQMNEENGPFIEDQLELVENGSFSTDHMKTIKKIRKLFTRYLNSVNVWSKQIWTDRQFHLQDEVLFSIHKLFGGIKFSSITFDIRSTALKAFVSPEIRRGLGIYLTPDDVVKMMVNIVKPKSGTKVYDIAVGSGTFLKEVLHFWCGKKTKQKHEVYGTDINPRMLFLADLNIGHMSNIVFHKRLTDALDSTHLSEGTWPKPNSFDYIFTNPPFGVVLDNSTCNLSKYSICKSTEGKISDKQQSEVMFVEQSLRLIKPGGTLSIVLPRSVATNLTLKSAREVLGSFGYVYAIISLPSETFQTSGTQTTTIVLFIRKYKKSEKPSQKIKVGMAIVTNVGFDSTGRIREGNQLLRIERDYKKSIDKSTNFGLWSFSEVTKENSFAKLPSLLSGKSSIKRGTKLDQILELACTGRTPARSSYTDKGLFLVKVGNLSGKGINWMSRDRNFVDSKESAKRTKSERLMLKKYDILLTSSAHSPIYIAKKIDIVWKIPDWLNSKASFVGEVMLLRPNLELVDPFDLLAFLRMPETAKEIRGMIRGQTAHLHPNDLRELIVPNGILRPNQDLKKLNESLRKLAVLNEDINELIHENNNLSERAYKNLDMLVDTI